MNEQESTISWTNQEPQTDPLVQVERHPTKPKEIMQNLKRDIINPLPDPLNNREIREYLMNLHYLNSTVSNSLFYGEDRSPDTATSAYEYKNLELKTPEVE